MELEFISIHKLDEMKPEDFAVFKLVKDKSVFIESIKILKENTEYQPVIRLGFHAHIYGDIKNPVNFDYLPVLFINEIFKKVNLPDFKSNFNIDIDICAVKSEVNDGSNFPVKNKGNYLDDEDPIANTILAVCIDNDIIQVQFPSFNLLDNKFFKDNLVNNLIVMKNAKNLEKELVTKDNLQTKKIKI